MSLISFTKLRYDCLSRLLAFQSSIGLVAKVTRGSAGTGALEETGKKRVEEGSEDDLSAIGDRERHPEDQDKLEDVVEGCQGLRSAHATQIRFSGAHDLRNQ
jgi:hypothetical protein